MCWGSDLRRGKKLGLGRGGGKSASNERKREELKVIRGWRERERIMEREWEEREKVMEWDRERVKVMRELGRETN